MKKNLIQKIQLVLLLAAVAVAGSTFLPAGAEADPPVPPGDPCGGQSPCNGGNLPCAREWDPVTGTWERCTQAPDCI